MGGMIFSCSELCHAVSPRVYAAPTGRQSLGASEAGIGNAGSHLKEDNLVDLTPKTATTAAQQYRPLPGIVHIRLVHYGRGLLDAIERARLLACGHRRALERGLIVKPVAPGGASLTPTTSHLFSGRR